MPGHTPGHRSYWRPDDSVLILGDVLAHQHPVTQQVSLIEPLRRFTLDPALASLAIAEEQARARATLIVAAADVPLAIGSVYRRLRPRAVPPVGRPSRWSARAGHHSRPSGRPCLRRLQMPDDCDSRLVQLGAALPDARSAQAPGGMHPYKYATLYRRPFAVGPLTMTPTRS
jgi:hypothetical protein